jgi:proline dehydrogenase
MKNFSSNHYNIINRILFKRISLSSIKKEMEKQHSVSFKSIQTQFQYLGKVIKFLIKRLSKSHFNNRSVASKGSRKINREDFLCKLGISPY